MPSMVSKRQTICSVVVLAIVCLVFVPSVSASIPPLSAACLADRSVGCCPGHVKLLQMEADGCLISDVIDAVTPDNALATCSICEDGFNSVAEAYRSSSGESCGIVLQAVAMFPFACKRAGGATPGVCISVVKRIVASLNDPANIDVNDLDGACTTGGCWSSYLSHLKDVEYDITGVSYADYDDRIGGPTALIACLNVDNEYCLPRRPNFLANTMPAVPSALQLFSVQVDTSYCNNGCDRALLSNELGYMSATGLPDFQTEATRRYFTSLCTGGCTSKLLQNQQMPPGQQLYLDYEWQHCELIYDNRNNPVCLPNCLNFVTLVKQSFGCCARFALESLALIIENRGSHLLPGLGAADVGYFVRAASQACGVDLASGCPSGACDSEGTCAVDHTPGGSFMAIQPSETFTATTRITNIDLDTINTDEAQDAFSYKFRQDIAAMIGALPEYISVTSASSASGTISWSLQGRTVAETAALGQAYNSLAGSGAVLLPSLASYAGGDMVTADAVCPSDIIPNYAYLPSIGTVTTDCAALQDLRAAQGVLVDCSVPDYQDEYGNQVWIVSAALLDNASPCAP